MKKGIQAMEIQAGLNGVSAGTFKGIELIHCSADGDVKVAFPGGDETVSMYAGSDRAISSHDITILGGTFDLNR